MKIELLMKPPAGTTGEDPEGKAYLEKYVVFANWWTAHGWSPVPVEVLPVLGAYVTYEEEPVAAAWLYQDNSSPVCMLEWLVSNPELQPLVTFKGIKKLLEYFRFEAAALGYKHMMTACKVPALARIYESADFKRTDEGMTHLISDLSE